MISFFFIEGDRLQAVRDQRLLRRMLQVLEGTKPASTIGWDGTPSACLTLNECWFDIDALFNDDAMFGELGDLVTRDVVPIKHPHRAAYFVDPVGVLKTLVTFRQTAQLIGALKLRKVTIEDVRRVVGKREIVTRGEIVSPRSLGRIRLLIEARILTKLEEPSSFLNDDRDPFTEVTAQETLDAFYKYVEMLTASLYDTEAKRQRQRGVVFFSN